MARVSRTEMDLAEVGVHGIGHRARQLQPDAFSLRVLLSLKRMQAHPGHQRQGHDGSGRK